MSEHGKDVSRAETQCLPPSYKLLQCCHLAVGKTTTTTFTVGGFVKINYYNYINIFIISVSGMVYVILSEIIIYFRYVCW